MATHYEGTEAEKQALDVYIKLMRAAQSVADRTSGPIEDADLSPSQFGVLETLYHLGPQMVSQLADKHLRSRNNFTVVIDNLERMGLVRRERGAVDRRAVMVHLTDCGHERIARVLPAFVEAVTEDVAVLSAQEQAELCRLLRRLGKKEGR